MEVSEKIKTMIKGWEGCRLEAYRCPAGVWTIGYGHTGPDVKPGMRITQARAEELFDRDIATHAAQVENALRQAGVKVAGCRYDALVSIAYNIGVGALRRSTLLRRVAADPDDPDIRGAFMAWNRAGGRVMAGLTKRRKAEADHYFGK